MKKIIPFLIFSGICLIFLQHALADLETGLVAYYPFNGNANDETGNGYNGIVVGATLTEDRNGLPASAYFFDGLDDFIRIGQEPNVPSWPSYAVSLWFLHNGEGDPTNGYGHKIIDKTVWYHDFYLSVARHTNGELIYKTYEGGPGDIAHYYDYRDSAWHHIVISKTGTNGEMWVDGNLVGTSNATKTVYSWGDLLIGYSESGDYFQRKYWSGKIDDIRIYNRALSEDEIKMLFLLKKIRIEAHIDGRSQLILSENTAQWHHLDYAAPGRHEFRDEPTIINRVDWFPVWPNIPDEENRDCDCFSDVFAGVDPPLPFAETAVFLNTIRSRNLTQIIQHPTKENDFELIIEFDDNAPGGSDDYITEIEFTSAPNQSPEAICQDVTVPTEPGLCTADASVDNGSFDPDGDEITLDQEPFGPYDLGDTVVTLTVNDEKGASDTCDATVTVVDEEDPVISSVSASPNKLWTPNHKFVPVVLAVDASDNCDSTCQIISVASNEPVNGLGDGDTAHDWVITGDLTLELRAERSGTGNGRIYTITVECADSSGNSSISTATVTVPHDKGKKNQNNKKKK